MSILEKLSTVWTRFRFVVCMWAASRGLILLSMFMFVPLFVPELRQDAQNFSVLTRWDGEWYQQIATTGYEYVADGKPYPIAFFPLFPIVSRIVMSIGLPFPIAGSLVNQFAFLGAMVLIYQWISERHNVKAAKWTIAILAWCPMSIYASATYAEGLFLLLSSLALRAFERQKYAQAALWGALTTATRMNGMVLVPTFAIVSLKEKRGWKALGVALFAAIGFALYCAFCAVQFGDPIAFLHVQGAFGQRSSAGFDGFRWGRNILHGFVGSIKSSGELRDPFHPVQVAVILAAGTALWRYQMRVKKPLAIALGTVLLIWWWLLWGDSLIKTAMVFGGGVLLWQARQQLSFTMLTYGAIALWLILFSGSAGSTDRFAFAAVSWSIVTGLWLARQQFVNWSIVIYSGIVMAIMAGQFAMNKWIS